MLRILREGKYQGRAVIGNPTVDVFRDLPIYYPDHPTVSWKDVALGKMIESDAVVTPTTLNICVVGRGASALGAMTELKEIALKNPNLTINITNHFYDSEVVEAGDPQVTTDTKWGRIFSVKPGANQQEIGCMRFPSIAVLTWNYIWKAYPTQGLDLLVKFPNPGRVPTQFLFRDMNVIFENGAAIANMNNAEQVANFTVMEAVKNGVIEYLLALKDSRGHDTLYFSNLLVGPSGSDPGIIGKLDDEVNVIWDDWNNFINEFDVPLIDKVHDAIDKLIFDKVISLTPTRDRSYYVELFGRYGFGTGGFRPLNNVTFNEIARLLIWNYSDEYLFPGNNGDSAVANTDFAQRLRNGLSNTANFMYTEGPNRKVLLIGRPASNPQKLTVVSSNASGNVLTEDYDYVLVCTSHHAAQRILEPYTGLKENEAIPSGSQFVFYVNKQRINYTTTAAFLHPYDLKKGGQGTLYAALKNMHMMRSTKYFTDVLETEFNTYSPSNAGASRVKMVISDTDLSASYILDGQSDGPNPTKNILVSYTWGDEASNEASRLKGLTQYAGALGALASNTETALRNRHAEAANRFGQTNNSTSVGVFWLKNLLSSATARTGYMYDWTSDQDARGGFKLDWASETAFSTALYDHYRVSVLDSEGVTNPQPKQRMFAAGCSFSHYGGWLEGAFHTGITAVAGIMRSQFGDAVFSVQGKRLYMPTPANAPAGKENK